jgi:hypothetical protein
VRLLAILLLAVVMWSSPAQEAPSVVSLCGREATKELRAEVVKLFLKYPVPYNVQIHVLEPEVLGLYVQKTPPNMRFIFIMARLGAKRQVQVFRHEYQHMLQEASGRGAKMTRQEREAEASKAEKGEMTVKDSEKPKAQP